MKVRFTPRALVEAERKRKWWRENRDEMLMKKTANHVYFTVTQTELVILAIWGASRKRAPSLKSR